jgi:hypothetical protein
MQTPLEIHAAEHRLLLDQVARHTGMTDPVAVDMSVFREPLLRVARKGDLVPLSGALVRDWNPDLRAQSAGAYLGMRVYHVQGITFAEVVFPYNHNRLHQCHDFMAVDRKDYRQLYRIAWRCRQKSEPPSPRPVLAADQARILLQNTIGFLDPVNLRRIRRYGGRARRGVLLTGNPGNGKTMACRWIWEECRQRRWEWKLVTPDMYRQARGNSCNASEAVKQLFSVEKRGIIFFDDLDIALRDRETVDETDDQAVFLGALDGIAINEGAVYVFTTNCSLGLIDRAFKRPGRIDVVLHFTEPNAALRRELVERWDPEIRRHLDLDSVVASTDGNSYAELEELRNLLVLNFLETDQWNWSWALKQFELNRHDLGGKTRGQVGFAPVLRA